MFERDRSVHLQRHIVLNEIDLTAKVELLFEKGKPDTYPVPGSQPPSYGRARLKGRLRKREISQPDDGIEVVDDEPLVTLEEIVES
jgi:hypothetical protein